MYSPKYWITSVLFGLGILTLKVISVILTYTMNPPSMHLYQVLTTVSSIIGSSVFWTISISGCLLAFQMCLALNFLGKHKQDFTLSFLNNLSNPNLIPIQSSNTINSEILEGDLKGFQVNLKSFKNNCLPIAKFARRLSLYVILAVGIFSISYFLVNLVNLESEINSSLFVLFFILIVGILLSLFVFILPQYQIHKVLKDAKLNLLNYITKEEEKILTTLIINASNRKNPGPHKFEGHDLSFMYNFANSIVTWPFDYFQLFTTLFSSATLAIVFGTIGLLIRFR